jgi:hypothetical protein
MEIAILILVVVAVILLALLMFFTFQNWIQSKETRIQLANYSMEIKKGFEINETLLREFKQHFSDEIQSSEKRNLEKFELANSTISNRLNELESSIKILKDSFESRMKEIDTNLSEKLVGELKFLTKKYLLEVQEEQTIILKKFDSTIEEIRQTQANTLKAITEPLNLGIDD